MKLPIFKFVLKIISCWSISMTIARKSLSGNSNVWFMLVLESVDFFLIQVAISLVLDMMDIFF